MGKPLIYLVGSLRNARIPKIGIQLRKAGFDVYDDWFSPGPEADDRWKEHQMAKGLAYIEALRGPAAVQTYYWDKVWLDRADGAVLVYPAGRSAHLELGYIRGLGKPGWILLDGDQERWDVMTLFATGVHMTMARLVKDMKEWPWSVAKRGKFGCLPSKFVKAR